MSSEALVVSGAIVPFAVDGEFTIYRIAELKQALLGSLERGTLLDLDLSGVTELDSAGVQLLLLAVKTARAQAKLIRLVGISPAVRDVFDLVNLATYLGPAPGTGGVES
ncbi:MAG TPA: STAS domain-containing protein [Polyangiaceae bacterium]|jgi:anti-anti-sigma factor|nr:STAS domain-containing protein [Polyangiaceae bacterium]